MQKQVCLMVELGLGFDANMKVLHRKIAHKEIKFKYINIYAHPPQGQSTNSCLPNFTVEHV